MPLTISTDINQDRSKTQEICLSPSWSDHGEKARRKEKRRAEKEQKEREKKLRHEEEQQRSADLKAGKRLSKRPPPAAMETQKMPTALRRNSWISILSSQPSSGENTRRSSREEKRHSGISFGSIKSKRSESTPATSTESATAGASEQRRPIVSPIAPKIPSFRWSSSRRSSTDGRKSTSPENEEPHEKDLIAFAYRLETSEFMTETEKIDFSKVAHSPRAKNSMKASSGAPAIKRSATEPTLISVPYESLPSRSSQGSAEGRSHGPESARAIESSGAPRDKHSPSQAANDHLPSLGVEHQTRMRPSHDGGSYVHKQRMYQQQQSIAGFEDQQAIKDATERAAELAAEHVAALDEGPNPTAERGQPSGSNEVAQSTKATRSSGKEDSISSVYTKQRNRSDSPHVESAPAKPMPITPTPFSQGTSQVPKVAEEKQQNRDRASLQSSQEPKIASKPQTPAVSKTDKILGFRRRAKQPPALVSLPYAAEHHVEVVQTAPLDTQPIEEPVIKRSKIERMFKEPRPAFANRERRSSSSSRSKESLPEIKPTQSHSRTRTSSSTVLNDHTASPLPRSTTEPVLNKAKMPVDLANAAKKDGICEDRHVKSETRPKRSHQSNIVGGAKQEGTSVSETKSQAKAKNKMADPDHDPETLIPKKQAHEVIVESETGEGLIRKTSIKRPRSNPHLQTQTTATNSLPTLDFLPPLKHQPLVKRERQSPTRPATNNSSSISISQFQESTASQAYEPPNAPDLKLIPRSPLRPPSQFPVPGANRFNRSSPDVGTVAFGKGNLADGVDAKPIAKLFVVCCKCKFWHDLPSKLYEAMALPLELHKAEKGKVAGARLETAVKCPWCEHAMTTRCCQGWTTVVYLHERHH